MSGKLLRAFPGYGNHPAQFILFDRHHGVSQGRYRSLNIGHGVGDLPEAVEENRQLVKQSMSVSCLAYARQVHGDRVKVITEKTGPVERFDGYDALITRQCDVGLMIQHADCQPVLLYDPVCQAIGAVHSGWRGSVANILARTVEAMESSFATKPSDLQVVVGPSLGPCCAEFINYAKELPIAFREFMVGEAHFDFWQISGWQLSECGVLPENITFSATCTSCSPDYFSYRRACRESGGVTGRNCSVVKLLADTR